MTKSLPRPLRKQAYGQAAAMSWLDRWGVFLSEQRIKQCLKSLGCSRPVVLDLGCGYQARLLRRLAPALKQGIGVDLDLAVDLDRIPGLRPMRGRLEIVLKKIPPSSVDFIILNSVLEHLDGPQGVLAASWARLRPGGALFVNVPTWLGKSCLEFAAFRLHASPAQEMDDHKMYYNRKTLWPLLVAAGFKPSQIKLRYHKFGLNCFALCKKV